MAKIAMLYDDSVVTVVPVLGSSLGAPAGDFSVTANLSVFIDEEFTVTDGFELALETNASVVIV